MLIIYTILASFFLHSSLDAMQLVSPYASDTDSFESPRELSPISRRRALKAELKAQKEYEFQLSEQLYTGEISKEEYDAYFENRFIAMIQQIVPKESEIDAPNNCGNTRLHLAVVFADTKVPETLDACKSLVRQGASLDAKNRQGQTPLFLAAIHKASVPVTRAVLHSCPRVKPILRTIWLVFQRFSLGVPKVVLQQCIAPFVIYNVAQEHLVTIHRLLSEQHQDSIVDDSNPWAPRTKVVNYQLWQHTKNPEIKALLDPSNSAQHRIPLIREFSASIGIILPEEKKDETVV